MPHSIADGRGRGAVSPCVAQFPVIGALAIADYHAIGGWSLSSEVIPLYRFEATTSDFDTAKVGPFVI